MTIAEIVKANSARNYDKSYFVKIKDQVTSAALVADRQFDFFEYTHFYEYFNDCGYWDIIRVVDAILIGGYNQYEVTEMLSSAFLNNKNISKNYIDFREWANDNGICFDFYVYRKTQESNITVSMMFSVAE
jgi:hypothetical protein